MTKITFCLCFGIVIISLSCKQQQKPEPTVETVKIPLRHQPKKSAYHFEKATAWLSQKSRDSSDYHIVYAVNRTDGANFKKMDSIVVPDDLTGDIAYYMPFPLVVPSLEAIDKIVFFSYPTQTFAAYEKGQLIYTGPTNMGRKKDRTPTGLFFTNWKAEETTSTFDDEWVLRWNFNIENKLGVGWHQYSLPGYPASHSCLRLQEKDAKDLYDWADQWELADEETVKIKGTPVVVFGSYDFDKPKPWLQLVTHPKVLDISKEALEQITKPFWNSILKEQKNRESLQNNQK
ncbi:L,D-transpeptidase [Flavobacterium granuli]|uniref:Lipoprotein-anchoring transpeptidase ErfK/SrfK n=1 Tax=Flavobacterium granuli TaxID=280093 RepID=A0A1M5IR28_9FLAO|nr:L,D-transpeptidase [Flavobacterium granuli]PRZ28075.1 lipoprotein-anchoring transpeptidase ErfK/SrfK [Flavobacterium granuli]SHG30686.1 Lipoprotein-anchoring transpeptidase ErfK/SrfK [Flavobacterium granuli]